MKNSILPAVSAVVSLGVGAWSAVASAADSVPSPIGNNSMMANSPFTDYTAGVVAYVLLIGVLLAVMLIGGFLILNLGLMSKREEDHLGKRNPSDVGILQNNLWPQEQELGRVLPATEDQEESENEDERAA